MKYSIRVSGQVRGDVVEVDTIFMTEADRPDCSGVDTQDKMFWLTLPKSIFRHRDHSDVPAEYEMTVMELRSMVSYLKGYFGCDKVDLTALIGEI